MENVRIRLEACDLHHDRFRVNRIEAGAVLVGDCLVDVTCGGTGGIKGAEDHFNGF